MEGEFKIYIPKRITISFLICKFCAFQSWYFYFSCLDHSPPDSPLPHLINRPPFCNDDDIDDPDFRRGSGKHLVRCAVRYAKFLLYETNNGFSRWRQIETFYRTCRNRALIERLILILIPSWISDCFVGIVNLDLSAVFKKKTKNIILGA